MRYFPHPVRYVLAREALLRIAWPDFETLPADIVQTVRTWYCLRGTDAIERIGRKIIRDAPVRHLWPAADGSALGPCGRDIQCLRMLRERDV